MESKKFRDFLFELFEKDELNYTLGKIEKNATLSPIQRVMYPYSLMIYNKDYSRNGFIDINLAKEKVAFLDSYGDIGHNYTTINILIKMHKILEYLKRNGFQLDVVCNYISNLTRLKK